MSSLYKLSLYFLAAVTLVVAACEKSPSVQEGNSGEGDNWTPYYDLTGLTVDGKFPIVAWTGITAQESEYKMDIMRDCGINVYLGWYDTVEEVIMTLDNAQEAGVKAILSCDDILYHPAEFVPKVMSHPALFGYHIEDEPETSEFEMLSQIVNGILKVDDTHPCYINLYPNWAWGDIDSYRYKLNAFLTKVPQRFLSFDHYPIREIYGVSTLREEWYKNLEDIRYVAKAKKVPFWAFALSLSVGDEAEKCPIPTTAELRLQQFSNLAYGAQGFQYWTFHGIYRTSKSQIYDRVLQVNKELQALSKIFLGAEVTDVWHTGAELPYGTKALEKMPDGIKSLVTGDKGAVVSRVIKGSNTYIAIVNKDYQADMTLDIEFTGKAMKFDNMGYKAETQSERVTLSPGNIIVYQIN
jgi:hypothetical protein